MRKTPLCVLCRLGFPVAIGMLKPHQATGLKVLALPEPFLFASSSQEAADS